MMTGAALRSWLVRFSERGAKVRALRSALPDRPTGRWQVGLDSGSPLALRVRYEGRLELVWDGRRDRLAGHRWLGPREPLRDPALSRMFAEPARLCPVAAILPDGPRGWSLSFAPGATWARLCRTALAAPFADKGVGRLAADLPVRELAFEGERARLYLG